MPTWDEMRVKYTRVQKPESEPLIYALRPERAPTPKVKSKANWKNDKQRACQRFAWSPAVDTDSGLLVNSLFRAKRSYNHTSVAK